MQFIISVIDSGEAVAAGRSDSATQAEMVAIDEFNEKLQADGHWIFAAGLGSPEVARTIDNRSGARKFTDGPFAESKEFIAGFWIIEADNLDAATALAASGSEACNRKVEVRALLSAPD